MVVNVNVYCEECGTFDESGDKHSTEMIGSDKMYENMESAIHSRVYTCPNCYRDITVVLNFEVSQS